MTKLYTGGKAETFEGVFISMTHLDGLAPDRVEHSASAYGIGVTDVQLKDRGGVSRKLFYEFKK